MVLRRHAFASVCVIYIGLKLLLFRYSGVTASIGLKLLLFRYTGVTASIGLKLLLFRYTGVTASIGLCYRLIIIKPGQFIKWWFGPPNQERFDSLTMMGRECSRLDPSYQRHNIFACTCCDQLHPHHRLGIITPDVSPVQIYRPRNDG